MIHKPNERTYQSEVRDAQAEATREKILESVVVVMAGGAAELTVPAVAKEAGVSIPTVYRHFGNKQGLMSALVGHIGDRLGISPEMAPADITDIDGFVRVLFRQLEEADPLIRAALAAGPSPRSASVQVRMGAIQDLLERSDPPVPDDVTERLAQVMLILTCSQALQLWNDRFDLTTDQVADTVSWAIKAMVAGSRGDDS